jgi:hypothetical protein
VAEYRTLELAPESEIDTEGSRDLYVGRDGWKPVPVIGSARITEVRGPAVLELPGTSIVLPGDAVATRSSNGSIEITPATFSAAGASDSKELHVV